MTNRPLQVYLDSSDFSNLSQPGKRKPFEQVERKLLDWQDAGLIDLRFSFIHVVEASPVRPEHIPAARERVDCIARLCGPRTFIAPGDLFECEMRALKSTEGWPPEEPLLGDGNWMPSSLRQNIELPSVADVAAETLEAEPLNRAMRRKLKQKFLGSDGKLKSSAVRGLKEDLPASLAKLQEDYPLTDAGVSAARRYLLGKASRTDVEELIVGSVRDLPLFIDWYARKWDVASPLSAWFREEGTKLFRELVRGRKLAQGMLDAERLAGTTEQDLSTRLRNTFKGTPLNLVTDMVTRRWGESDSPVLSVKDAARYLPGVWTSAKVLSEVIASATARPRNLRNPDDGDFGDSVHCTYLPYVDVFRADSQVAAAIAAVKLPYATTVVGNLLDLPRVIEARLASASGTTFSAEKHT